MSIASNLNHNARARTWRRFRRHKLAMASLIVLFALIAAAAAAPLIESWLGVDALTADLHQRLLGPSLDHPLGTDEIGRDHLVRLLYGGRVSLTVGLIAALFSAVIGTIIGICAGYYGGRLDSFLMRITDSVIALPLLPLLIVLAAVDLTKLGFPEGLADAEDMSLYRIVLIVSLVGWTTVARLVRAETLSMRKREFVRAAMALGADTNRILLTHILPNVVSPIVVATTLSVGNIILFESVLSFLGLGIQPPVASWGNMLSNAQDLVWSSPELATWPGLFIFITVIAFNFLGDGLQDALDPRAGD
ncbi:MAG: ABC transporter permease [Alphaproteobacteria bacterium]|nr:ABC transporter permease [Alphaproteobacteria bacterium]